MTPVDHIHGSGEGKTPIVRKKTLNDIESQISIGGGFNDIETQLPIGKTNLINDIKSQLIIGSNLFICFLVLYYI